MASPSTVVTLGYGSFGSVNLIPTLGYGSLTGQPAEVTARLMLRINQTARLGLKTTRTATFQSGTIQ